MARLLAACLAVLAAALGCGVALAAGPTSAGTTPAGPLGTRGDAAVLLPVRMPAPSTAQPGAYAYRPTASIARDRGDTRSPARTSDALPAGGATLVVTAVVLPTRTIVVDAAGHVTGVWSNTPDRRPTESLYIARRTSLAGAPTRLTPSVWHEARTLLARADHATGRVA